MDSIDAEYQMWFAGSALSDTLIAISMIILVILNSCAQESPKFKIYIINSSYATTPLHSEALMPYAG